MKFQMLIPGRARAVLAATAVVLGTTLVAAVPALAIVPAAPTNPALTWTGDDTGSRDACFNFPCQGASPGHPWSFSATTTGLAIGDRVSFTFTSTINDRLHAVAMPLTIAPQSVDVTQTSGAPVDCYTVVDNLPTHPASVAVDWANQSFSFPMPVDVAAGQTAQFCFTDSPAIGMPLTPSDAVSSVASSPYKVKYTEPGGNVSASYRVLPRRPDPQADGDEPAPPYMHLFDSANNDVSNAGEAGTAFGFFNTTYKIVMKGTPGQVVSLTALSGRGESSPSGVVDPRVTVSCPATCAPDSGGVLNATFTVSPGATDHFVISSDCSVTGSDFSPTCEPGDSGVVAFTATAAPVPTPSPTASVKPALPRAGSAPASGPPWPGIAVLGILAAGAMVSLRRQARL